ncbi:MAG: aminotransferase class IV [Bdellovibrionales bacterium]|nr:aminotransferase class IV [Bdellovibrionales bacterium]
MELIFKSPHPFENKKAIVDFFQNGLLETLLVDKGQIEFLSEHISRISTSLQREFSTCLTEKDLERWTLQIKDQVLSKIEDTLSYRLNLYLELKSSQPHWSYWLEPYRPPQSPLLAEIHLLPDAKKSLTSKWVQCPRREEALNLLSQSGYDLIIWKNTDNYLLETHIGNIFYKWNEQMYTPPLEEILPGIVRQNILSSQTHIRERRLNETELPLLQGLWVTNSLLKMKPIEIVKVI